jgi:hypothetical protein
MRLGLVLGVLATVAGLWVLIPGTAQPSKPSEEVIRAGMKDLATCRQAFLPGPFSSRDPRIVQYMRLHEATWIECKNVWARYPSVNRFLTKEEIAMSDDSLDLRLDRLRVEMAP